jgi:DNA ligase-1
MVFDGELYNHDLREDFNGITSVVRKAKNKPEDLEKAKELIQYHVYDMVDEDRVFSKRQAALRNMLQQDPSPYLHVVQTKQVSSEKVLDDLYERWLAEGYEGQIVRLDTPYENKRSNALMKRKEFLTAEFPIVAMHEGEGNWRGAIKRFILAKPDTGQEFGAGVRGKFDDLARLLMAGQTPKWATVRYFTPTPDGIPRFPVVIDYGFEEERPD